MGKLQKNRKRIKTKLKKNMTSKSKNRATSRKTSGAPEIGKLNMHSHEDEHYHSDTSESPEIVYKLIRKTMKVDHVDCENKAIRKAQRALNKAQSSGNVDEIDDARLSLEESMQEKEEANKWMHPSEAIKNCQRY